MGGDSDMGFEASVSADACDEVIIFGVSMMPRYSFIAEEGTTVAQVIEALKHMPQDAKIRAYNGDSEQMEPVTGLLLLENGEVEICTDEP